MNASDHDYVALTGDITVVIYYDVGELHIARSRLASTLNAEHDGVRVRVNFPDADGGFQVLSPSSSRCLCRGSARRMTRIGCS